MNLGREGKINFMDTKGAEANLYDQLIGNSSFMCDIIPKLDMILECI